MCVCGWVGISVKENMKDDTPVPTGVGFIVNTVSQKDLDSHSYWIHFLPPGSPPPPPPSNFCVKYLLPLKQIFGNFNAHPS